MPSARSPQPDLLVDPAWLHAHLGDPKLRVVDATVWLRPRPVGPSRIDSGRDQWLASHIPGAAYLHMVDDLSDPDGAFAFMLRQPEALAVRLGEVGIADTDTIVVYGNGTPSAVTRAWWVLRVAGAADVRVLDGGLTRWQAEGRPVASGMETPAPARFVPQARPDLVATCDDVLAALDDPAIGLINALTTEQFHGTGGSHYGRPGRVPNSVSLPARALVDDDGRYRPYDQIEALLDAADLDRFDRLITYCGGGIAASTVHFILQRHGYANLSLYDASLNEWSNRTELPMVVG